MFDLLNSMAHLGCFACNGRKSTAASDLVLAVICKRSYAVVCMQKEDTTVTQVTDTIVR